MKKIAYIIYLDRPFNKWLKYLEKDAKNNNTYVIGTFLNENLCFSPSLINEVELLRISMISQRLEKMNTPLIIERSHDFNDLRKKLSFLLPDETVFCSYPKESVIPYYLKKLNTKARYYV